MHAMARLTVNPFRLLVAVLAVIGCVLLIVAEFTPLFAVSTDQAVIKEVKTGAHHSYAMIPIALVALLFTVGAVRGGSRPAIVGLGALGVIAVLIALVGDLPDTSKAGYATDRFVAARAAPKVGMYLETLGGALIIIAAGSGLLLTVGSSGEERPVPRPRERPRPEPS